MVFRSLRDRILFFFSLLLIVVQLIAFFVVSTANLQITEEQNANALAVGGRVFNRELEQNQQRLLQSARILSADTSFQAAIATQAPQDLGLVLESKRALFEADFMLLSGLDKSLVAATHYSIDQETPGLIASMIDRAKDEGHAEGAVIIDEQAYQLAVAPVLAPHPVAWVALGVAIDDALAANLYQVTGLQVSFFKQSDSTFKLLASTLEEHINALQTALDNQLLTTQGASSPLRVAGYKTSVSALGSEQSPVIAVLQRSDHDGMLAFEKLRNTLLMLVAFSLFLSLVGGYVIANNITRPVKLLASFARKIQGGDYGGKVTIEQVDEIGALAASLNHMSDGVAEREQEILRLAYADTLTGLPNRAMFNDRLSQAVHFGMRAGTPFTVLMMDLDRFKYINDVLGHEAGDKVLQEVSTRLQKVLRDSDTVARLGGDEFALLLATGNPERVQTAVHRILHVLEEPVTLNNQPVDIGGSIGIATFPEHGEQASTLLRHADIAMYSAKRTNSGFAFYDSECDAHQQEHLSLLGDLRRAVECDELEIYFQPKITFDKSDVIAVETLMRWQHPERGLVPPAEFIPFAEHTGAIRLITGWLIENAMAQCGHWYKQKMPIKISLNISARDLLNPELPTIMRQALEKNGVPSRMVCLEITESALMEDPVKAHKTVTLLHDMGLELSIDDYGTGYSSLAYVKNLPVNELKIDREFVKNMVSSAEDIAIVRSTIELGHNLGLKVVAEGIENEQELAMLKEFGCDEAQGFLISEALTADDLEQWLHENYDRPMPAVFNVNKRAANE
ncbi:MAG: putative bifunctional diguanylate cyclase/phosphodiesterase [Pseudomonadales bacterium]